MKARQEAGHVEGTVGEEGRSGLSKRMRRGLKMVCRETQRSPEEPGLATAGAVFKRGGPQVDRTSSSNTTGHGGKQRRHTAARCGGSTRRAGARANNLKSVFGTSPGLAK